jgi:hypothetical protein
MAVPQLSTTEPMAFRSWIQWSDLPRSTVYSCNWHLLIIGIPCPTLLQAPTALFREIHSVTVMVSNLLTVWHSNSRHCTGGMDAYVRAFSNSTTLNHDDFYSNPTILNAFLNYTTQIVSRYVNSPAIFGW